MNITYNDRINEQSELIKHGYEINTAAQLLANKYINLVEKEEI